VVVARMNRRRREKGEGRREKGEREKREVLI